MDTIEIDKKLYVSKYASMYWGNVQINGVNIPIDLALKLGLIFEKDK